MSIFVYLFMLPFIFQFATEAAFCIKNQSEGSNPFHFIETKLTARGKL